MERLIRQSKGGIVNGNIESYVSLKRKDNPYDTTKKNSNKHQGYQELLTYFQTISDEETSVKDILEKTKCSSAQLWKEARKENLSIEIKLENERVPFIEFLDRIRKEWKEVTIVIEEKIIDGRTWVRQFPVNSSTLIGSICHFIENELNTLGVLQEDKETWNFVLHHNHHLIGEPSCVKEEWLSKKRFGSKKNFMTDNIIYAYLIPEKEDYPVFGNRKQYTKMMEQQERRQLMEQQDQAYEELIQQQREYNQQLQESKKEEVIQPMEIDEPEMIEESPQEEKTLSKDELRLARLKFFEK